MAFFPFMIQMRDKLCVIGGGAKWHTEKFL